MTTSNLLMHSIDKQTVKKSSSPYKSQFKEDGVVKRVVRRQGQEMWRKTFVFLRGFHVVDKCMAHHSW